MITYSIIAGTTGVSIVLRIIDSTDGTPETGVVFNTSGIDMQYRREGAVSTAITEVTLAALTTAWTSGGFLHIGNGLYRLDLPDAACASGVSGALVHGTVTGMIVIGCYIQLTTSVAQTGDSFARIGATGSGLTTLATQTSVDTVDNFIDTEVAAIKAKTDQLTFTIANKVDANAQAIDGDANAGVNLRRGVSGNVLFSVGAGSTPTSIATSSMTPSAAVIGQFAGRIATFDANTTTVNLRGQAREISGSTAAGVLTVAAFTNTPASGDTGVIT